MTDTPDTSPAALLDCYDAGLFGGEDGFSRDWWHDYIRAELGRAHEFYAQQFAAEKEAHEKAIADLTQERDGAVKDHGDIIVELAEALQRAERAEADAAAMRQLVRNSFRAGRCSVEFHDKIMSFTAGRDLLARMERLREALRILHATVIGECPSLLNEDSGGDAKLALEIEALLADKEPTL